MKMQARVWRGTTFLTPLILLVPLIAQATFSSGSDGHDGIFSPTANVEVDMADHPDGIYQYVSVNIPTGVTVTFKPNAENTPVVWLVQGDCIIAASSTVDLSGKATGTVSAGAGGPGGYRGGNGMLGAGSTLAEMGQGPGGGEVTEGHYGGNGSFGTVGGVGAQAPPGNLYGNQYILPLIGGSGGGGSSAPGRVGAGGGGGGAILIAANHISVYGTILSRGGSPYNSTSLASGGAGSGGAIRLVTETLEGNGSLICSGNGSDWIMYTGWIESGNGRIRLEAFSDTFSGICTGETTRGMQSILFLPSGTAPSLAITQIGGISVPTNPSGSSSSPDVLLPGEIANPMSVVVHAMNIPINTPITVDVKPYSGASVSATAQNTGNLASSTATFSITIPRGGGTIMAKAVTAVNPARSDESQAKNLSYRDTGLTTDGERFKTAEVTTVLGGSSQLVYVTESGKRYPVKAQ